MVIAYAARLVMKKEKLKLKFRDQSIEVDGVRCAKCGIEAKVGALGKGDNLVFTTDGKKLGYVYPKAG